MKNRCFTYLPVIGLISLLLISCKSEVKEQNTKQIAKDSTVTTKKISAEPDYSGVYSLDESIGKLSVKISKDEKGYSSVFTEGSKEYAGKMTITKEGGSIYFDFNLKFSDKKTDTVSGEFADGKITIQNYGNSMNKYEFFKSVDAKYLELIKK